MYKHEDCRTDKNLVHIDLRLQTYSFLVKKCCLNWFSHVCCRVIFGLCWDLYSLSNALDFHIFVAILFRLLRHLQHGKLAYSWVYSCYCKFWVLRFKYLKDQPKIKLHDLMSDATPFQFSNG